MSVNLLHATDSFPVEPAPGAAIYWNLDVICERERFLGTYSVRWCRFNAFIPTVYIFPREVYIASEIGQVGRERLMTT